MIKQLIVPTFLGLIRRDILFLFFWSLNRDILNGLKLSCKVNLDPSKVQNLGLSKYCELDTEWSNSCKIEMTVLHLMKEGEGYIAKKMSVCNYYDL